MKGKARKWLGMGAAIWLALAESTLTACPAEGIVPSTEAEDIQEQPSRGFYIPEELSGNDFTDPEAEWSFTRSRESEHFILLWQDGFGEDPGAEGNPSWMRVDTGQLLELAEQCYATNAQRLGFRRGGSWLDRYKMEIYLYYQEEWLATGAGYDNVIGALWISPSTCQPAGAVLAHEIGHCFQYQVYCDGLLQGMPDDDSFGFRYAYEEGDGNTFWEQCAEWQAWQDFPADAFAWYYKDVWAKHAHRAFEHEWSRYQSYWLQYALAERFGEDAIGRVWWEAKYPEDALAAIKRIFFDGDQERYAAFLYEYAAKTATFDYDGVREYAGSWQGMYRTKLYPAADDPDWQQIGYMSCPDEGGFNVIRLDINGDGAQKESVTVCFRSMEEGSLLGLDDPGEVHTGPEGEAVESTAETYNTLGVTADEGGSSHCYGFVAICKDGSRVYSEMYREQEATVSFDLPEGTRSCFFVVAGTPKDHIAHRWDDDEANDRQLPYAVSFPVE